jgi:hypothetical protein
MDTVTRTVKCPVEFFGTSGQCRAKQITRIAIFDDRCHRCI